MSKLYLEYDPSSGVVLDATGCLVTTLTGFSPIQLETGGGVADVIKLKDAGFTADEIIAMKKAGI